MKPIPDQWTWLLKEPGPKVIVEALKHYGTLEHPGIGSNPDITKWAAEVGVQNQYTDDDIPWCGLFVAMVVKRSGYPSVSAPLWARNWIHFGKPSPIPMLGDILVFKRGGSGHVAFYVGENEHAYAVIGGNQSNSVTITWIDKMRLLEARRCPYQKQPDNVRAIVLDQHGVISTNEA